MNAPSRNASLLPCALAFTLALGCRGAAPEVALPDSPIDVLCAPAVARPPVVSELVQGTVRPRPDRTSRVASPVAGRLRELAVVEGQLVKRGELLAVVEAPSLGATLEEEQGAMSAARQAVQTAEQALERARRLDAQGVGARRDVEEAQVRLASATSELRAATARHQLAGGQLARARLTAPIDGVVLRVLRARGELVDGAGASDVAEIADLSELELRVELMPAALVRVREGMAATISIDAAPGRRMEGEVIAVSPSVDEVSGRGSARISLPPRALAADGLQLRVGLGGRAEIHAAAPPGAAPWIAVPAAAVRTRALGRRRSWCARTPSRAGSRSRAK